MQYGYWKDEVSDMDNDKVIVVIEDGETRMSVSNVLCCDGDIHITTFDNNLAHKATLGELKQMIHDTTSVDDDSGIYIQDYYGEYSTLHAVAITEDSILFAF